MYKWLSGCALLLAVSTTAGAQETLSKTEQTKVTIREIGHALDMFYTDCGRYPSVEEGLQALLTKPKACKNWGPDPYLKTLSKDPWGRSFLYESRSPKTYKLTSFGADGKEGGTYDNMDITLEK